jgi:hypothetical protein
MQIIASLLTKTPFFMKSSLGERIGKMGEYREEEAILDLNTNHVSSCWGRSSRLLYCRWLY